MAIYLDRDYYSVEDSASAEVVVSLDSRQWQGGKVEWSIKGGGKTLKNGSAASSAKSVINIPVKNLAPGTYTLDASLAGKDGKKLASSTVSLRRLSPLAGEVKLDKFKRVMLVDGKPFFTMAPLEQFFFANAAMYKGNWEEPIDNIMAYWQKAGFKSVIVVSRTLPFEVTQKGWDKVFDSAQKHGLRVIGWLGVSPSQSELGRPFIDRYKNHPALLAWYVFDEPEISDVKPEDVVKVVDMAKSVDPYHPVFGNFTEIGPRTKYAGLPGDVVSTDMYLTSGHPIKQIMELIKVQEERAREKRVLTWAWLVGNNTLNHTREPLAEEQVAQTYASIISASTGLMYFSGEVFGAKHWEALKKTNAEVLQLSPAIFGEKMPSIGSGHRDVLSMVRKQGGKTYLFTVNIGTETPQCTFNLPGGTKSAEAAVLFENRNVPVRGGVLKDTFKPYERHVYQIPD